MAWKKVVPDESPKPRTCFNCIHYVPCLMAAVIDKMPPRMLNIDGLDAPLRKIDLYDTLAGCCLLFKGREK